MRLIQWIEAAKHNFGADAAVPVLTFGQLAAEDAEKTTALLQALIATPTGQRRMPGEFLDELTLRVAGYLELDTDKVAGAIKRAQDQAPPTPLGQVGAAANTATALVQAAGQVGAAVNTATALVQRATPVPVP